MCYVYVNDIREGQRYLKENTVFAFTDEMEASGPENRPISFFSQFLVTPTQLPTQPFHSIHFIDKRQ